MTTFVLPDLGEGLQEAELVAWHVGEGDHVVADQPFQHGDIAADKKPTVVVVDGLGLVPSLQNPYMVAHPPMLYLGYVGLTIPFAFAAGAMLSGQTDERCLQIASIYMHAGLERIRNRNSLTRGPKLTKRERECLSWVAAGKTDWEISQILKIAEQTVHEYVQNALIKLNATTRAQAVAIAITTRLIEA